jgi:hypothetical protein
MTLHSASYSPPGEDFWTVVLRINIEAEAFAKRFDTELKLLGRQMRMCAPAIDKSGRELPNFVPSRADSLEFRPHVGSYRPNDSVVDGLPGHEAVRAKHTLDQLFSFFIRHHVSDHLVVLRDT